MFTQPLMYTRIKETKHVLDVYKEKILKEGVASDGYVQVRKNCQLSFVSVKFTVGIIFRKKWENTEKF